MPWGEAPAEPLNLLVGCGSGRLWFVSVLIFGLRKAAARRVAAEPNREERREANDAVVFNSGLRDAPESVSSERAERRTWTKEKV